MEVLYANVSSLLTSASFHSSSSWWSGLTSFVLAQLLGLSVSSLSHWCRIYGICFSLCVLGWKNWKRPGNMRPRRRAPSLCDITLLTPLFFFVCNKTFYKRNGKTKRRCKHCDYYYYCGVTGSTITCITAFFSHMSSFHWLDFWPDFYGIINSKGGGGGCRTFASWHSLHFFMDCFVLFGREEVLRRWRKRTHDMPEEDCHWKDVYKGCCRKSQRIGRPCWNTLGSYCIS